MDWREHITVPLQTGKKQCLNGREFSVIPSLHGQESKEGVCFGTIFPCHQSIFSNYAIYEYIE